MSSDAGTFSLLPCSEVSKTFDSSSKKDFGKVVYSNQDTNDRSKKIKKRSKTVIPKQ